MGSLRVHRNTNPATREAAPYLLDVQSDLLDHLATRVVVPLFRADRAPTIARLTPEITFEGEKLLLMAPQLAGVPCASLGPVAGDLRESRDAVMAALDLLFTGF